MRLFWVCFGSANSRDLESQASEDLDVAAGTKRADFLVLPSGAFTAGLGHGCWYMSLTFLLNGLSSLLAYMKSDASHSLFIPSPVLPNSANAFPDAVNGQNPT